MSANLHLVVACQNLSTAIRTTLRRNDINARTRAGGCLLSLGKCGPALMLELAINSKGRDVGKGSETRVLSCFCIMLGPGLNKDIKQVMQRFRSQGQTNTGAHSGGSCYKHTAAQALKTPWLDMRDGVTSGRFDVHRSFSVQGPRPLLSREFIIWKSMERASYVRKTNFGFFSTN